MIGFSIPSLPKEVFSAIKSAVANEGLLMMKILTFRHRVSIEWPIKKHDTLGKWSTTPMIETTNYMSIIVPAKA